MDAVFKALADATRRRLLDSLNVRNGQTLRELCAELDMARQSVSKHLAVLEAAGVVTTWWRGREKLHYLDAAPINAVADRWIHRYDRERAKALADLTSALEQGPMSDTEFVYTTYVNTTPQRLWQALIDPAFTRRYWGAELGSDWEVGSPVLWKEGSGGFRDLGQVVLESDPPRRLAYSWHHFQPEHAEHFGWSEQEFAEMSAEQRSRVVFDIEPHGDAAVKLTVTHDGFAPNSTMLQAVSGKLTGSGGWPELLADLKTLLESGAAPVVVQRSLRVASPPERVWPMLTEDGRFRRWYAFDGATIEPTPGGAVVLHWKDHGTFRGRVTDAEVPHLFAYRIAVTPDVEPDESNSTLVTMTVTPTDGGSVVTVRHTDFEHLATEHGCPEDLAVAESQGWEAGLSLLAEEVSALDSAH